DRTEPAAKRPESADELGGAAGRAGRGGRVLRPPGTPRRLVAAARGRRWRRWRGPRSFVHRLVAQRNLLRALAPRSPARREARVPALIRGAGDRTRIHRRVARRPAAQRGLRVSLLSVAAPVLLAGVLQPPAGLWERWCWSGAFVYPVGDPVQLSARS